MLIYGTSQQCKTPTFLIICTHEVLLTRLSRNIKSVLLKLENIMRGELPFLITKTLNGKSRYIVFSDTSKIMSLTRNTRNLLSERNHPLASYGADYYLRIQSHAEKMNVKNYSLARAFLTVQAQLRKVTALYVMEAVIRIKTTWKSWLNLQQVFSAIF